MYRKLFYQSFKSKVYPLVNLEPKLKPLSKISDNVHKEINKVLLEPPKIPSRLGKTQFKNITNSQFAGQKLVCHYNQVSQEDLLEHIADYKEIKYKWNQYGLQDRLDIFLEAANKLEHKYYDKMMAYTILGQNKTPYEAEVDSICELVDFLRFNVSYIYELNKKQPITSLKENSFTINNSSQYLPLNGFIASITPFNFTAIGGNLALTPLMLGNCVYWKPSPNAILSNYLIYKILEECGLPEGILNFVPYNGPEFLNLVTKRKDLGGILFTGSSQVFDNIYQEIGKNIAEYQNYPRIIGETGGKNYHFVHQSMENDIEYIAKKTFESAFGYSGQKCSACSRLYLPENMLESFLEELEVNIRNYLEVHRDNYGLINRNSWEKSKELLVKIKKDTDSQTKIVIGGNIEEKNYFMEPTVVVSKDKQSFLFEEEFFAPLLTIYPYKEKELYETMDLCRNGTSYSLTGAVFSKDKEFLEEFEDKMRYTCGNYYINDKSTGSVVGQQPFGGSGKSGTNDKAGDINFIYRLTNQKNVKECVYF